MSIPHKPKPGIVDRLLKAGVVVRVCDQDEYFDDLHFEYQNDLDEAIFNHELECVSHNARLLRLSARQIRIKKFIADQRKSKLVFQNAVHDLALEEYWDDRARTSVLAGVRQNLANQEQAARVVVRVSMWSDDLLPAAAERRVFSGSPVTTEVPGARLRTEPRRPGAPDSPAA